MKAFRFRLQAVLTLREQAEQAAQQRCAEAYAAVEAAAGRLRTADAAIEQSDERRRACLSGRAPVFELEQLRKHSLVLQEHRTLCVRALAEARQRADDAWRALVVATQQREALERLRARQKRVYDYQVARAEQKFLDDLSGRGPTLVDAWRDLPVAL